MTADKSRSGRQCLRGHKMDESWEVCLYCQSEDRARERSGGRPGATMVGEVPQAHAADSRKTMMMSQPPGQEQSQSGGRDKGGSQREDSLQATRISPQPAEGFGSYGSGKAAGEEMPPQRSMVMPQESQPASGSRSVSRDTRKMVALLTTFTWHPEGEVFPIREGKNFIGRSQISSEAHHRDCDIQIPQDEWMTAEHALILCRGGNFELMDRISANGTFLNGSMLKSNQSYDLQNYDQIKTGSTTWTFILVAPQGQVEQPPVSEEQPRNLAEPEDIEVP